MVDYTLCQLTKPQYLSKQTFILSLYMPFFTGMSQKLGLTCLIVQTAKTCCYRELEINEANHEKNTATSYQSIRIQSMYGNIRISGNTYIYIQL